MRYGWRRHSELPRRGYWITLIAPLFAVAVILLGVLWELSYADTDGPMMDKAPATAQPAPGTETIALDASSEAQLEASRTEAANLRQQLADVNQQLQQVNTSLVAADEKVQSLQGELAAAAQKLAEAKADREEALRVAGKMWEDWRHLRQGLTSTCAALAADQSTAAQNRDAAALSGACTEAKQEE
jgi:chromosome segregation ATPase